MCALLHVEIVHEIHLLPIKKPQLANHDSKDD